MARAVGGTIGNFRGRLGKVNGETILSARSASFKENKNPKHIEEKMNCSTLISVSPLILK
jgi:Sec-independent protein translocase protein TatA